MLLPASLLLRRAFLAELIFAAVQAKADGLGHRTVAARLGIAPATVRGWIRVMTRRAEVVRNWFLGVAVTAGVDVSIPKATGTPCGEVVAAISVAAAAVTGRFAGSGFVGDGRLWAVAVACSGGRLLYPGWPRAFGGAVPTPVAPDVAGGEARSSRM